MIDLDLQISDEFGPRYGKTGIYVRARSQSGRIVDADIAQLEGPSLLRWLRSRGGENAWAENTVGQLLGHRVPLA